MFYWAVPSRTEQRLQALAAPPPKSDWAATVVRIAGPFAKLSPPEGNWEASPLRLRLLNAGIRHRDARVVFFGAKTLLPLLLAALAFTLLRALNQSHNLALLFFVLLAALVGCYLPNVLLAMAVRARKREVFENFPDAADLMLVCVEAGLGMDGALTKVSEELRRKSRALAEELHLTNLEMRAGASREQALRNLALRTGIEEVGTFATMLTQADKFGTGIGDSMRVFSDDLRHKRQTRAEEAAAKVPTKMLFPLVLFIFPSIIMVVLGPAIIQVVRTLAPMLAHH
jgi:tight adherence protein C